MIGSDAFNLGSDSIDIELRFRVHVELVRVRREFGACALYVNKKKTYSTEIVIYHLS